MVDIMNRTVEEMLDFSKHSDNDLLGYYQQFHNGSAVAEAVSKELMKRGYETKVIPSKYADGRRSAVARNTLLFPKEQLLGNNENN